MSKLRLATTFTLMLWGSGVGATILDSFDVGGFSGTQPIVGQDIGASSGGFGRTLDASGSGNLTIAINVGLATGVYGHSQDSGVTGQSSIAYDLGGADLSNDANAFRLELVTLDLNGVLSISVDNVFQDLATTVILLDNGLVTPSFVDFLFSDFAGVDFTNVSTVVLGVDGSNTAALDATLDNFVTVCSTLGASGGSGTAANGNTNAGLCTVLPEPGALVLFGLGLLGFGLRRGAFKHSS